jgi:hypothetical protein
MFDVNDKTEGSVRKKPYKSPIPGDPKGAKPVVTKPDELDSPEMGLVHTRLMGLYTHELDRQHDNRLEMAVDFDFYDNIQWREEDAQVLRDRGQVPLVYNVISSTIDWITGTEKRGRADYNVLPRRKDMPKPAEKKKALLKYLEDCNHSQFTVSAAFAEAAKGGIGWLEDGIQDEDDDEPIYARAESWRNMLWDSTAKEPDLKDGRYIYRTKWIDLDILQAVFPKRKGVLERSVDDAAGAYMIDEEGDEPMDAAEAEHSMGAWSSRSHNEYGYQRERVRVIEAWYRKPATKQSLKGGQFDREIYDPHSPGHIEAVESGESELVDRLVMRVHVCIMTSVGLLWHSESPYRHNRFPFTPIWCYRRDRDGMPYGVIRRLRDIQEDINKRASKALHIISTNKVIMDKGAVDDLDAFIEENARPDAVIVKNQGKELTLNVDRGLEQAHMDMMARSIQMIQTQSGVTDENMGRKTNATSGIAIERRQTQGSMATAGLFDNLRLAYLISGEKKLSLIEQFMSEKKQFRITNIRGNPEFVDINDGLPENDITRSKADFVLSEGEWRASVRQAAAEQLLEVMKGLPPEVALVMLDIAVESMDLPMREELVRRIRAITGQSDPDQEEPSEEDMARAAAAQKQDQMNEALFMANLRKVVGEAMRAEAQAVQAEATAVKTNMQALGGPKRGAIDVAADIAVAPAIVPVSDRLMREVGFEGRTEKEEAARAAAEQQALAEQLAEREAAAQQAAQQSSPQAPPYAPGLAG